MELLSKYLLDFHFGLFQSCVKNLLFDNIKLVGVRVVSVFNLATFCILPPNQILVYNIWAWWQHF